MAFSPWTQYDKQINPPLFAAKPQAGMPRQLRASERRSVNCVDVPYFVTSH